MQKKSAESPAESSEEDSSSQITQRKSKPPEKRSRAWGRYSAYTLQFKLQAIRNVQASDATTVAKKLKLPRSTLETWLKKYNLQEFETTLKKGKGDDIRRKGAHLQSGSGRPLRNPQRLDEELAEWVLHQRDLQCPVSTIMLQAKAEVIIGSSYPSLRLHQVGHRSSWGGTTWHFVPKHASPKSLLLIWKSNWRNFSSKCEDSVKPMNTLLRWPLTWMRHPCTLTSFQAGHYPVRASGKSLYAEQLSPNTN